MATTRTDEFTGLLPEEVLALPKVEVPIDGVTGFCMRDEEKQVVFFVFEEGVSFPDHSHCAQYGTIIAGEMVLEVEGRTNLYQSGDHYHVPEGVLHRTVFTRRTALVDMSDDPARYKLLG
jgi:quercetin dioxygenase-like cupin family protein